MEVAVVSSNGTRRATAQGQDIYAVTAPIVAEAAVRILDPVFQHYGAKALGQAFDAKEFLEAMSGYLEVKLDHV